jgi:hypothetical protein
MSDEFSTMSIFVAEPGVGGGDWLVTESWTRLSEQFFRFDMWSSARGLGCQAERQRREVGVVWCYAVKARVWTSAIIKVQVAADRSAGVADAFVGPQMHLLVFNAGPKPLDEHVVPPSAPAVHG